MPVSPSSPCSHLSSRGTMKTVATLLLVGMLIIWTELPTGTTCPWIRRRPAVFAGMLWDGRGEEKGNHWGASLLCPSAAWSKPLPSLAGSAWSCPPVRVTCARPNPPNQCYSSRQCPPNHKCCLSSCGTRCISRPFFASLSHGRVLGSHLPSPTSLGSRGGM